MKFIIPMSDEEIRMHKPVCPDFVDFRAGIRCAERVYGIADLLAQAERDEALLRQALEALVYAPVGFPQCPYTITALRNRLGEKE